MSFWARYFTGLVRCHHCGKDFDPRDVKDNPYKEPHCQDCLDLVKEMRETLVNQRVTNG
jgi:hypothetical protein